MTDASDFKVPGYLRSAHLQTILNGQGPRKWRARRILQGLESRGLELVAGDGTRLLAELDHGVDSDHSALVVLLHGWEGSSRSSYLITTTARLLAQGFDVLRVNLRDHGDSHHLNRELLIGFYILFHLLWVISGCPCHIILKWGGFILSISVHCLTKKIDSKSLLGFNQDSNPQPQTTEEESLALNHWGWSTVKGRDYL